MTTTHEQRQYHYVMTMQTPEGQVGTVEGTLTVDLGAPDATRSGAFHHVRGLLVREMGRSGAVVVWSFEPNEL